MAHWAEAYIGTPWANGASGPDAYDCWGLVRTVYAKQLAIGLPAVDVDAHKIALVCRVVSDIKSSLAWRPVTSRREYDVVLMGRARIPHHVGVCAADGVLHAVEGAGVVLQTERSLIAHGWRVLGRYRLALQ